MRQLRRSARGPLAALLILGLAACATPVQWSPYPADLDALSAEDWARDIECLASELMRRNPHLRDDPEMAKRFVAEAAASATSLRADSAQDLPLADYALAELRRLLALVGEGHTALNAYPTSGFRAFFRSFAAEGGYETRLIALDPESARIERIGGTGTVSANAALGDILLGIVPPQGEGPARAPLVPVAARSAEADGAPMLDALLDHHLSIEANIPEDAKELARREARWNLLADARLMAGLGLAARAPDGLRIIRFRMRAADASEYDLVIRETSARTALLTAREGNAPFSARGTTPWWYIRLNPIGAPDPNGPVLYLKYASCDYEALPLLKSVLRELERGSAERLIIDLRHNGGGASAPGTWFAHRLSGIAALKKAGKIYVLIGADTFSSGLWLAVDLMASTPALFAGQAIPESPDSYGEVGRFALPRSGLVIGHSTTFHRYAAGKRLRLKEGLIYPDPGLAVEPRYEDWRQGRDPLLDLVLGK